MSTASDNDEQLPGIDRELLGRHLRAHGWSDRLRIEPVLGGTSNLVFRLHDDGTGRMAILRRPPLSTVGGANHGIVREATILQSLYGRGVRVPAVLEICEDGEVLGVPFFVMDYVDGLTLQDRSATERELTPAARHRGAVSMVEQLAALHLIAAATLPWGDPSKGAGYVGRQLAHWGRVVEEIAPEDKRLAELRGRLASSAPVAGQVTVVHGDYRLGNAILGPDGEVRAVLDWELATLGDPRADLAFLLTTFPEGEEELATDPESAGAAAGFPSRDALIGVYQDSTRWPMVDLEWFLTYAQWRVASILVLSLHQLTQGGMDGWGTSPAGVRERITGLTELALSSRSIG